VLRVRPDRMDEYRQRHAYVWPEMLEVLATTTLAQPLAIHADGALLVGQVDADDLQAWQAVMARTEVNAGWRAGIAAFFVGLTIASTMLAAYRRYLVWQAASIWSSMSSVSTRTTSLSMPPARM
jgi:L-rhamnose mutarotase